MDEAEASPDKAPQVLQAAAVQAYGRPGTYVTRNHVIKRANILDPEEFRMIAEYLDKNGWIAEADGDYGIFVVTPERNSLVA